MASAHTPLSLALMAWTGAPERSSSLKGRRWGEMGTQYPGDTQGVIFEGQGHRLPRSGLTRQG